MNIIETIRIQNYIISPSQKVNVEIIDRSTSTKMRSEVISIPNDLGLEKRRIEQPFPELRSLSPSLPPTTRILHARPEMTLKFNTNLGVAQFNHSCMLQTQGTSVTHQTLKNDIVLHGVESSMYV